MIKEFNIFQTGGRNKGGKHQYLLEIMAAALMQDKSVYYASLNPDHAGIVTSCNPETGEIKQIKKREFIKAEFDTCLVHERWEDIRKLYTQEPTRPYEDEYDVKN